MAAIARLNLIRQHLPLHPSQPSLSPNPATSSSATIMATANSPDTKMKADYPEPLPKVSMPFLHRLNCFLRLWLLKFLANLYFFYQRLVNSPSRGSQPTLVRRYACRPMLEVRIFYPRDYRAGEKLLPVYFNVHGGGFALCSASVDDEFCSSWATRTGMLVVSLDYRKVPLHPFPTATYDVAAQVEAALADESLPIDRSRVAVGGFSAGGNLALSVAQLPPLKELVQAAVVYYPIVDFGHPPNEKLDSRPYTSGPKDNLEAASWWLDWGYVRVGQNRRDPLLSPEYARPQDLPPWIYIVGAQWDMLRLESQVMIHRLAGLEDKEDQEAPFEKGTYKWTLAMGQSHGFTHGRGRNPARRAQRQQLCEKIYTEAHEWLKKSVLR